MEPNMNDPSSHHEEEEFQFSEEEGKDTSPSEAQGALRSSFNSQGESKSRRTKSILLFIGIFAGLFCLYKLYGLFTATSNQTLKSPLKEVKFEESKPAKKIEASVQSASLSQIPSPPASSQSSSATSPTEEQKTLLESHQNLPAEPSSVVNDKVSSLKESQDNLQSQITGLSSAITEIQNNISMLTQQVGEVVAKKNVTPPPPTEKEAASKIEPKSDKTQDKNEPFKAVIDKTENKTVCKSASVRKHVYKVHHVNHQRAQSVYKMYAVRSMIQGRAWLIASDDTTFTVSVGDELPGYGRIQTINADSGTVSTSSGKVIGYLQGDH